MLVGILADTHDNLDTLRRALDDFRRRGVEHILHAGDWVAPFTVRELGASGIPFEGVFGNNDGDRILLSSASGGRIHRPGHAAEVGGRRVLLLHEPDNVEELAGSGRFDVIIHGHDHRPAVSSIGSTLVLDPGEACGWVSGRPTAALLETEALDTEILELR